MEDAVGVARDDPEAGEGDGARDNTGSECPAAEPVLEVLIVELGRVCAQEDGGEVGGAGNREHANEDRSGVKPAAELAARSVADGDAAGGDAADCGPERERRQHR